MSILSASQAKENLYKIIDQTTESHEPIFITGEKNNAVLISEEDWNAIQETIYLNSIPGMAESIIEGMNTPIEECSETLDW